MTSVAFRATRCSVQVFSRRFLQVGVLGLLIVALALSAQAANFSNASLKGGYSFLANLRTANVNTPQFAAVGAMTFDGAGNVTGSYTSISDHAVQSGALGGTYLVKSNGTGTLSLTTGLTAQFAITLNSTAAGVAHGVELLQTDDTSNEVVSGTALLQSTTAGKYTAASLKGNFALQYNPWTADANLAEDGGVGIFSFDGRGNIKGSVTIMFDGGKVGGTLKATYKVNSDGSGTISVVSKHNVQFAFALNSVAAGQAKGLQFLDTNTGDGNGNLVITGNALKQ
jgi:hypothetical protein